MKALDLQIRELIDAPPTGDSVNLTYYDQRGRIVFTASKGLPSVGFTRPELNAIKSMQSGTVTRNVTDATLPTGPVERTLEYQATLTHQNRETDYATVWSRLDSKC